MEVDNKEGLAGVKHSEASKQERKQHDFHICAVDGSSPHYALPNESRKVDSVGVSIVPTVARAVVTISLYDYTIASQAS